MIRKSLIKCIVALVILAVGAGGHPAPQDSLDGPGRIFKDELMDKLVGNWKSDGTVMKRAVQYNIHADWSLNHQFLELHLKDAGTPSAYEARVFIGYDNASERYVAHWIDVFGGRWSETLGFGARSGNAVKFVFEYPDGPFHTTFTWNPDTSTWNLLMQQKDKSGKWNVFGEQVLRKGPKN